MNNITKPTRHALFSFACAWADIFGPRVTHVHKEHTLTCSPAEVGVLDNLTNRKLKQLV